ncbi:MAG TPA: hypothetical protein VFE53_13605 [Mucilaginibacter sp.]|jgi:hypothetical protein|nr:hypothetical protein [Mucilaginibacter sp.]
MKTILKVNLFILAAIAVVAISCKGKSGSSGSDAVSATNSTTAASAKGNSVMDSLNITDPDEKKVCALYDDAITDYLTNIKTLSTDTSAAAKQKRDDLDKKWKEKEAAIKPQVESLRQKIAMNPTEALKFTQFSVYESKRLMGVMMEYEKNMLKNMPTTAPGK